MPNNYSRNIYDRHPDKIIRNHLCPLCGALVMPFLGVLGTEHKGHCPKCGTVTYVSMPETVTFEFTSYIRAELEQERHKTLQVVLDEASVSTPKTDAPEVAPWDVIPDAPIFGSAEWFAGLPEVKF